MMMPEQQYDQPFVDRIQSNACHDLIQHLNDSHILKRLDIE